MLASWSIKKKLGLCVALIALIVLTLSISGMISVYAYRDVVRTLSFRAEELPRAYELTQSVEQLGRELTSLELDYSQKSRDPRHIPTSDWAGFRFQIMEVDDKLKKYRFQLSQVEPGAGISDNREELKAVHLIQQSLEIIKEQYSLDSWVGEPDFGGLGREVDTMQTLAAELPSHLQRKLTELRGNVRGKYRTLIGLTICATILTAVLLTWLIKFFYDAVVCPLRAVIYGSRRVASGDFEHRVQLNSRDEMAELAASLNAMTSRFKEIRDDLDRQVRERTREVVRSEQLASVGFLAAGVAHEINNPLQAIAICAESLESRLHDIIVADDAKPDTEHNDEITILRKYLRRIQDEAFRCKGITEKLLDYSRLGDAEKQETDLNAVIADAIDLVRTISAYRGKRIEFHPKGKVVARVVTREIKQVVLNLITNALDSLDQNGWVRLELQRTGLHAELTVQDNGCGMTEEVKKHLFEPFFTRRRNGQGTGLGLSITYRIVQDHGGTIDTSSDGPGRGSRFRIILPLNQHEERFEKLPAA